MASRTAAWACSWRPKTRWAVGDADGGNAVDVDTDGGNAVDGDNAVDVTAQKGDSNVLAAFRISPAGGIGSACKQAYHSVRAFPADAECMRSCPGCCVARVLTEVDSDLGQWRGT